MTYCVYASRWLSNDYTPKRCCFVNARVIRKQQFDDYAYLFKMTIQNVSSTSRVVTTPLVQII